MRNYEIIARDAAGEKVALIDHYYPGRWLVLAYADRYWNQPRRCRTLKAARARAEELGAVAFDTPRPYGEVAP